MKFSLFAAFVFLLSACSSSHTPIAENAGASYALIHSAMILNREVPQNFINSCVEATDLLKIDPHAAIDTVALRQLLDSSVLSNQSCQNVINNAPGVDDKILLKQKALHYAQVFNSALEDEFPRFIQLMGSASERRYEAGQKLLLAKLKMIEAAQDEFEEADRETREKYEIQLVNAN